jgi:hypothetical protein
MTLPMAKADLRPAATVREGLPYIYATWLAKLWAADRECEHCAWLKAHYQFRKRDDRIDHLAKWKTDHDALMAERAQQLVADGWSVTTENANAWRVPGKTAIVAGKCDLVARRDDEILIVDGKTGTQRNSDYYQVLLYLAAWPLAFSVDPARVRGELVYPTLTIPIPNTELTLERVAALWALVRRIAHMESPGATPSATECRWCEIPVTVCPYRIDAPVEDAAVTELF